MRELICIVCPQGCRLRVEEKQDYRVTGNRCARGAEYGRTELQNPTRTVTSTVAVRGAMYPRCPVKTSAPIPKHLIFKAVEALSGIELRAPVKMGQVVIHDVCGTGADFIATRDM